MLQKKTLSKAQALQKIIQYCLYQERCCKEVKQKLYNYGLYKRETEEIIADIIQNNYLNEERYAVQFAGGKFRMKRWGRKKIQYELQQKSISSHLITKALKQIEEKEYMQTLEKLALIKWDSLDGETSLTRQAKTHAFLQQKGFEPALISAALKKIKFK
jgi:regulatory protein